MAVRLMILRLLLFSLCGLALVRGLNPIVVIIRTGRVIVTRQVTKAWCWWIRWTNLMWMSSACDGEHVGVTLASTRFLLRDFC